MKSFIEKSEKPIIRLRNGFTYTIPRYYRILYFSEEKKQKLREFAITKSFKVFNSRMDFFDDMKEKESLYQYDLKMKEKLKRRFINV